jgi:6-phosphofructokinase 1
LEGGMLKRRAMGRRDGLAVIAEGIAENMDPTELQEIPGVEIRSDPYGNLRLGEIPLATILKRGVQSRFAERGESISIVDVTLGYELRCAPPIPFDIDYTRTLGYGAARFLHEEQSDERLKLGGLVCLEGARLQVIPFEDLVDPETNRTRVRIVDVQSEHYKVAAEYMVRLEQDDLTDPSSLSGLADAAGMSNDEFTAAFATAV